MSSKKTNFKETQNMIKKIIHFVVLSHYYWIYNGLYKYFYRVLIS
jgi:hypothetical protein